MRRHGLAAKRLGALLGALLGPLLGALLAAGCQRITDDMARQPRTNPAASSELFADGEATRRPVDGTVVHALGDLAYVSSGRAGRVGAEPAAAPTDPALIDRGQRRYTIYCLPCHGARGDGDGEVVRRGFPAPAPLASPALRAAPDLRLHAAIRQGVGVMASFADRVDTADAWAIVAYLRVLQRDAAVASAAAAAASGAAR